ncbi:MAG: hypothetical protein KIS66_13605 [Fimbriimonadaceae bacterium]|nr:hypothetical protein [Fimbriimonadaceae bacterium]
MSRTEVYRCDSCREKWRKEPRSGERYFGECADCGRDLCPWCQRYACDECEHCLCEGCALKRRKAEQSPLCGEHEVPRVWESPSRTADNAERLWGSPSGAIAVIERTAREIDSYQGDAQNDVLVVLRQRAVERPTTRGRAKRKAIENAWEAWEAGTP